jgi:hypothetical protein
MLLRVVLAIVAENVALDAVVDHVHDVLLVGILEIVRSMNCSWGYLHFVLPGQSLFGLDVELQVSACLLIEYLGFLFRFGLGCLLLS